MVTNKRTSNTQTGQLWAAIL